MEAYGMLVMQVCQANHLDYYYGPGKIAYTSCYLLKWNWEDGMQVAGHSAYALSRKEKLYMGVFYDALRWNPAYAFSCEIIHSKIV